MSLGISIGLAAFISLPGGGGIAGGGRTVFAQTDEVSPAATPNIGAAAIGDAADDDEVVYLDPEGFIRVLDPVQGPGEPEIQWHSPTGGWVNFALSDFNQDGDDEIVAVGHVEGFSQLVIFDPVADAASADQLINGVAWEILFQKAFPGEPRLVATGDFDLAVPGKEILYNYETLPESRKNPDDPIHFDFLRQVVEGTDGDVDGRAWEVFGLLPTGNEWTWVAAGNVTGDATDEIALIDEKRGNLSVYTNPKFGIHRIYRNASEERPWRGAAFGQFGISLYEELVAIREVDYPLSSLFAFRYIPPQEENESGTMADLFHAVFIPSPRYLFLADIAGNGDYEAVMLRNVSQELGARPRLIVRNFGTESITLQEAQLDVDNGYQSGVGADVDGDGRDEIVIMRDDRIRIYGEPQNSVAAEDYSLSTNSETIGAGNLDGADVAGVAVLAATPDSITVTIRSGSVEEPMSIDIIEITEGLPVSYTVGIEGDSTWLSLENPAGSTPASESISLNIADLSPGTYRERLVIATDDPRVVNAPVAVEIVLVVEAVVSAIPAQVHSTYYPCMEGLEERDRSLAIVGTSNITYSLAVDGNPPWLSVTPRSGHVPGLATLTFHPEERTRNEEETQIVFRAEMPDGSNQFSYVPVSLLCANERLFLPQIAR